MSAEKENAKNSAERLLEDYLYTSDKARMSSMVKGMTESAVAQLSKAMETLRDPSRDIAAQMAEADDAIDALEEQIDHECLYSIAMRQPLRENLRYVYGIMKMIIDIERIGDQSVDIARLLRKYAESGAPARPLPRTDEMEAIGAKCAEMAGDFLKALEDEDEGILKRMGRKHDDVKSVYEDSGTLLFKSLSLPCSAEEHIGVHISLQILWHLKRISDHLINLAEKVHFIATGISPLTLKKRRRAAQYDETRIWSDV